MNWDKSKILCSQCGVEIPGPKCYRIDMGAPLDICTPIFCSEQHAKDYEPDNLRFSRLKALAAIMPELTESEKHDARRQLGIL